MDSHYKKMLDLLSEMEIGFSAGMYQENKYISFRPGHCKVDMVGVCHVTFYFDKDGNFMNLLVEE